MIQAVRAICRKRAQLLGQDAQVLGARVTQYDDSAVPFQKLKTLRLVQDTNGRPFVPVDYSGTTQLIGEGNSAPRSVANEVKVSYKDASNTLDRMAFQPSSLIDPTEEGYSTSRALWDQAQGLRIKGCQVERENNHDGHGVHLSACQARPKMADRENLLPMLEDGQYVGVTARRDSWTKMQLHPAHSSQAHGPGRHLTRPHSMPAKCQETTEHFLQPEEHTLRRVILNA